MKQIQLALYEVHLQDSGMMETNVVSYEHFGYYELIAMKQCFCILLSRS
jgi:hypothetical protein